MRTDRHAKNLRNLRRFDLDRRFLDLLEKSDPTLPNLVVYTFLLSLNKSQLVKLKAKQRSLLKSFNSATKEDIKATSRIFSMKANLRIYSIDIRNKEMIVLRLINELKGIIS